MIQEYWTFNGNIIDKVQASVAFQIFMWKAYEHIEHALGL